MTVPSEDTDRIIQNLCDYITFYYLLFIESLLRYLVCCFSLQTVRTFELEVCQKHQL